MNRSSQFISGAVIGLAALLAVGTGYAQAADYKIGFVNTERLFREAAPAKRLQLRASVFCFSSCSSCFRVFVAMHLLH